MPRITELPLASSGNLNGDELVPIVQGGDTVQTTVGEIASVAAEFVGGVTSVNGDTGDVVLTAADVGATADPSLLSAVSGLTGDEILTVEQGGVPVQVTAQQIADLAPAGTVTGRQEIPIMASAMTPSASGGCASLATVATSASHPDIQSLDFDATTAEYAQFSIAMPKKWDEGTVTFKPIWSHASTTTNFGVVWNLQGVAVSDGETVDAAFGTAQSSTDTGGNTNYEYIGPESSAITIAGSPAAGDVVHFRVYRDPTAGSDTLAVDARLHGIVLIVNVDAGNDA